MPLSASRLLDCALQESMLYYIFVLLFELLGLTNPSTAQVVRDQPSIAERVGGKGGYTKCTEKNVV